MFKPGFYTIKQVENLLRGAKFTDKRRKLVKQVNEGTKKPEFVPVYEEIKRNIRIQSVEQQGSWTQIQLNNGIKIKIKNF
jgi:hypothetical protein